MKHFISVLYILTLSQIRMQESEKLHVTVLYESLCPDSINFIQNQLKPSYPHFKDYIHINFVPFGKSSSFNNGEYFECQHGPNECKGNKIQSCALNELQDDSLQVSYVICQMTKNVDLYGQECAQRSGINYQNVLNCYSTQLGTQMQLDAEALTKQIAPKFIPTILYNYQFSQELQDQSQDNFPGVLCALLKNSAPVCLSS